MGSPQATGPVLRLGAEAAASPADASAARREDTSLGVVVSLIGVATAAIGLLGVAAPGQLIALLARWSVLTRLWVTVVLRIGLGALFLLAAPHCRLPDLVRLMGGLEFSAAVVLLSLGSARLERFVAWWLERPPAFVRYWCSGALGLGLLLAYAGARPGC